nr:hypothetical protein [Tanacetum cinerariifolium]
KKYPKKYPFSTAMASAVICLSKGQRFNFSRPSPSQAAEVSSLLVQQVLDKCSALVLRVYGLETANTAPQLEILRLKARVKKLERLKKVVAASTPIPAAKPAVVVVSTPIIETLSVKDKGKGILVEDPKPMKKKDQIEMDAEYARKLQEEEESHVQAKDVQAKDVQAKGIQYIRRYHRYKKKPQSESEARKNMIAYLKNTKDDTHQLYTYFITLLKNFDREDLEDLWKIMKARFSTSKPTNFSDDYLLVTLKTMFEKIDTQDVI